MSAENERIKLRATFYNNLAVGSAVGGLLLPYIAISPKLYRRQDTSFGGLSDVISLDLILAMFIAGALTLFFRSRADAWIKSLEDED